MEMLLWWGLYLGCLAATVRWWRQGHVSGLAVIAAAVVVLWGPDGPLPIGGGIVAVRELDHRDRERKATRPESLRRQLLDTYGFAVFTVVLFYFTFGRPPARLHAGTALLLLWLATARLFLVEDVPRTWRLRRKVLVLIGLAAVLDPVLVLLLR